MIAYDLVRAIISDVTELVVEPIDDKTYDNRQRYCRMIRVRTNHGEIFELVLQSVQKKHLKVHTNIWFGWLKPKVYKPRK
jgi:hypothetical protein